MSNIFISLTQKYTPTVNVKPINLSIPVSLGTKPSMIQNGGPESSRMYNKKCSNNSPLLVTTTPASNTTLKKSLSNTNCSQINVQTVSNNDAQQILFGAFFPPPIPPPKFLQVPPTRSNNEPYARQTPCVGPHRWDR